MKIYIAGKITGEPNYPGRLYAHLLRNDRYGRRDLPA